MKYELKDKEIKEKITLDDKDYMIFEMLSKILNNLEKARKHK